jgi:hypothetical protein
MLKFAKNSALRIAKNIGTFDMVAGSRWRQQRLLILCYHGLSQKDEHKWSNLFVTPAFFRSRLEILARRRYRVLPLNDALTMLREGSLPPRSVVITFDDGFHDFHQHGFPMLREFGLPATVYQMTCDADHPFPVFNLVLSYLFWRGAGRRLDGAACNVPGVFDLSPGGDRTSAVDVFLEAARQRDYTAAQKNEIAARVAGELGVDYGEILRLRMLQLMTSSEVSEIAAGGIDVQLHTHRHRTPLDEEMFRREIRDNRQWLAAATGTQPTHFCYPSGCYRGEFLPWLRAEQVVSATTCDSGMATRTCEPLLLPRLLDFMHVTEVDFEGWLAGFSSLLPHRRR